MFGKSDLLNIFVGQPRIISAKCLQQGISKPVYLCDLSYKSREPKSHIVKKHTFFAPERYTAEILYTDSLNSA